MQFVKITNKFYIQNEKCILKNTIAGRHGPLLPVGEIRPSTDCNLISADCALKSCLIVKLIKGSCLQQNCIRALFQAI